MKEDCRPGIKDCSTQDSAAWPIQKNLSLYPKTGFFNVMKALLAEQRLAGHFFRLFDTE